MEGVVFMSEKANADPPMLLELPPTGESSGFFRRFRSGKTPDSAEVRLQITRAYGVFAIIALIVAGSTVAVRTYYKLIEIFMTCSLHFILATSFFFVSFFVIHRRATKLHTERVGVIDMFLITGTLSFVSIFFAIDFDRQFLARGLSCAACALLLAYAGRRIKFDTKVHPLIFYIIVCAAAGGIHALASLIIPRPLHIEHAVYPIIYAAIILIYIDCGLHVAARNENNWASPEGELGAPTVAGLVQRVFLGAIYFPHPIVSRMGMNVY